MMLKIKNAVKENNQIPEGTDWILAGNG